MIQLSVHLTPHQVDELSLRDTRVVVVDVLRLRRPAKEVAPAAEAPV